MLIRFHIRYFISTRSSYNRIHSLFSSISFYLNCTKFIPIPLTCITKVKHDAVGMSCYKRWSLCNWLSHKKMSVVEGEDFVVPQIHYNENGSLLSAEHRWFVEYTHTHKHTHTHVRPVGESCAHTDSDTREWIVVKWQDNECGWLWSIMSTNGFPMFPFNNESEWAELDGISFTKYMSVCPGGKKQLQIHVGVTLNCFVNTHQ